MEHIRMEIDVLVHFLLQISSLTFAFSWHCYWVSCETFRVRTGCPNQWGNQCLPLIHHLCVLHKL